MLAQFHLGEFFSSMTALDRALFLAINHGLHSGFDNYWIGYATWLGNGWFGFPVAIVVLYFLDRDYASFRRNFLLLAIAGIVGGVALNVLKQVFHAPRPLTVFAPEIAAGRVYVNVMFGNLYWNSFPSGHSQTAFTLATVLAWAGRKSSTIHWPRVTIIFAVASLVGISRIYCGAHFPTDVIAGAILGGGSAWICCYSGERWRARRLSLIHSDL